MTEKSTDNYANKLARSYIKDFSFKNDAGETIKYSRLIFEFYVNGKPLTFQSKITDNEKIALDFAEDFSKSDLNDSETDKYGFLK